MGFNEHNMKLTVKEFINKHPIGVEILLSISMVSLANVRTSSLV
jgi:hypothetical protein